MWLQKQTQLQYNNIIQIKFATGELYESYPTNYSDVHLRDRAPTIYQDLYQFNTEEGSTDSELISCGNTNYDFCSASQCNYSITQQVKCFINESNIFA